MTTAPWPCWAKAWQFAHFKLCGSFFSLSRAFSAPGSLDILFSDDAQACFFSSLARSGLCYVFFRRCNAQRSASRYRGTGPVKPLKIYLAEGVPCSDFEPGTGSGVRMKSCDAFGSSSKAAWEEISGRADRATSALFASVFTLARRVDPVSVGLF